MELPQEILELYNQQLMEFKQYLDDTLTSSSFDSAKRQEIKDKAHYYAGSALAIGDHERIMSLRALEAAIIDSPTPNQLIQTCLKDMKLF